VKLVDMTLVSTLISSNHMKFCSHNSVATVQYKMRQSRQGPVTSLQY